MRWQLGPAAFFAGIPGTVGGALAMNAGAFGGETWTGVESVDTVDCRGVLHTRARADFAVGYRTVRGAPRGVVPGRSVPVRARHRDHATTLKAHARKTRRDAAARRAELRLGVPQPPGRSRGTAHRARGLKGLRVGGAEVSTKHANFIVNTGKATAADIEALIERVRATVERDSGVRLELEVRVIGEVAAARGGSAA